MSCCPFDETVDQQFSAKKVEKELDRYRRRGMGPTARMLLEGLSAAGLANGTLLDVGAGVGGLTFALLERGIDRAVVVEASRAYAAAAATEAARRGVAEHVTLVHGDFLDVASGVPPADVVTMDRVICCFPMFAELLTAALDHAASAFAMSYPRDRWHVRAGMWLENARRRNGFRTFVHPDIPMRRLVEEAGFVLVSRRHSIVWSADVFVRRLRERTPASSSGAGRGLPPPGK